MRKGTAYAVPFSSVAFTATTTHGTVPVHPALATFRMTA
jgi:hypothetical protein